MPIFNVTTRNKGGKVAFIAIPGILARSQDQLEPLMPVLESYDLEITSFDYLDEHFNADLCVTVIAREVHANILRGKPTILFGTSLGGMLAALALERLREIVGVDTLRAMVSTILVDAPSSGRDIILAPFLPSGTGPLVGKMISRLSPSEKANTGYGKRLLGSFMVPPKDHEIELEQDGPTAEEIKRLAVNGLSGHLFTVWFDQLRWMCRSQLHTYAVEGLDVTYIACVKGNVTVRQPQATKAWRPYVSRVVEVATPHCAYLQARGTWSKVIKEELERIHASED